MNVFRACSLVLLTFWCSISFGAESSASRVETEVTAVLDAFMASFNASDPEAHAATYQFPHYRLARGEMLSWETREDAIYAHKSIFAALPTTGWYRSAWVDRKIININDSKVHVATRFTRFRQDGSEIVTAESLYILTKENGRWGIKMRSSYL